MQTCVQSQVYRHIQDISGTACKLTLQMGKAINWSHSGTETISASLGVIVGGRRWVPVSVWLYRPWQENKQHWDLVNRPSCKLVARSSSQVSGGALLMPRQNVTVDDTWSRWFFLKTDANMDFVAVKKENPWHVWRPSGEVFLVCTAS